MGQVQSEMVGQTESTQTQTHQSSSSSPHSSQPATSMESLLAEAALFGDGENESLDVKAQKALECPCIADLRNGPCGAQFSKAFICFLKSTSEKKGSDCVHPFVALQNCIKANPDAFSKVILEDDEVKNKEAPPEDYEIFPPIWSSEAQSAKSMF